MPKLVEEVRASDFRRTDTGFVIKKMKSGEYRAGPDGNPKLSFRKIDTPPKKGIAGIPDDDLSALFLVGHTVCFCVSRALSRFF